MGTTLAVVQSVGIVPCFNEAWKNSEFNLVHTQLLAVLRTKLVSFGDRSFNVVGPRLWNALSIAIKRIETVQLFIKALKTHIFKEEFC